MIKPIKLPREQSAIALPIPIYAFLGDTVILLVWVAVLLGYGWMTYAVTNSLTYRVTYETE